MHALSVLFLMGKYCMMKLTNAKYYMIQANVVVRFHRKNDFYKRTQYAFQMKITKCMCVPHKLYRQNEEILCTLHVELAVAKLLLVEDVGIGQTTSCMLSTRSAN